jgi:arylformamidase
MSGAFIDLSHPNRDGMLVGGELGSPTFHELVREPSPHGFTILITEFSSASHVGTHVDSPRHFYPDGARTDELPIESFCGEAVLTVVEKERGAPITVADIEAGGPDTRPGDILIVKTGWGEHYRPDERELYVDHPYIAEPTADWIVESGLKMLATDTMSPDLPAPRRPSSDYSLPVHRRLLRAGVLIAENLKLDQLEAGRYEFYAFPIVLAYGDGGPARIVARPL